MITSMQKTGGGTQRAMETKGDRQNQDCHQGEQGSTAPTDDYLGADRVVPMIQTPTTSENDFRGEVRQSSGSTLRQTTSVLFVGYLSELFDEVDHLTLPEALGMAVYHIVVIYILFKLI